MKDIYLVNYSVKGIKALDQRVSLSFYKKTLSKDLNTQEYNIKGIYGMNGSGKSGIIASVEILRNILINQGYLNNPIAQKNLDAMIHKGTGELEIQAEYLVRAEGPVSLFRYSVTLSRDVTGKYIISKESLASKNAFSKKDAMETIFEVSNGEIVCIYGKEADEYAASIVNKTMNLLSTASMSALFYEKVLFPEWKNKEKGEKKTLFWAGMAMLFLFGTRLHVYLDQSDDHREYVTRNSLRCYDDNE